MEDARQNTKSAQVEVDDDLLNSGLSLDEDDAATIEGADVVDASQVAVAVENHQVESKAGTAASAGEKVEADAEAGDDATGEAGAAGPDDDGESEINPDLVLTRKVNGLAALLRNYYSRLSKGDACADPLRGQGRVLALMQVKPEATQKELQFLLGMKQQSLSELLAKLEAKGFVERAKSENDARMTIVRLTEAGAAAAPSLDGAGQPSEAYACFSEDERTQFEQLVDKLSASLEETLGDVGLEKHGHDDEGKGEQKRYRHGQKGRSGGAFAMPSGRGKGAAGKGVGRGKGAAGKDAAGKGAGRGKGSAAAKPTGRGSGSTAGKGAGHGTGSSSARGAGRGKGGAVGATVGVGKGKGQGKGQGKGAGRTASATSGNVNASTLIDIAAGLAGLGSTRSGRGRGKGFL